MRRLPTGFVLVLAVSYATSVAPLQGATTIRLLDDGRYLLVHASGMTSAAAGARGVEKSIDKAAKRERKRDQLPPGQ